MGGRRLRRGNGERERDGEHGAGRSHGVELYRTLTLAEPMAVLLQLMGE
jgi:hypothetical protein